MLSHPVLSNSVTPWTVARQAPLSMGILQARILEWVAMSSSRRASQSRDQSPFSCIPGGFFTVWATREALISHAICLSLSDLTQVDISLPPLYIWSLYCVSAPFLCWTFNTNSGQYQPGAQRRTRYRAKHLVSISNPLLTATQWRGHGSRSPGKSAPNVHWVFSAFVLLNIKRGHSSEKSCPSSGWLHSLNFFWIKESDTKHRFV